MKRILVMANRDFVLYNFRFELLKALINSGYEVVVFLPYGPKVDLMVEAGCQFIPMEIENREKNPLHDLSLIVNYRKTIQSLRPDVILLYTTKVCIYGGMVASKLCVPYLLNVSGLGTALETPGMLQKLMIRLYALASKNADCVFFQNEGNRRFFEDHGMAFKRHRMIPGSGVNLERWRVLPYPDEKDGIHFLFIARIIREKGIEEYIEAARQVRESHPECVFHVLGPCDGDYEQLLKDSQQRGFIQYHGMVQDTGEYLKWAHCVVHPSYYPEGISNVLLEGAASGRPLITTDREGCRETVDDGVSGFICRQRDVSSLVDCLRRFLSLSGQQRRAMGLAGRDKVSREFDRNRVTEVYMEEIAHLTQSE